MNKPKVKMIIAILLASAFIFGVTRYIFYLKENIDTLENQKQNLLLELEKEKNELNKLQVKNNSLKDNLRAARKRLDKSFLELSLSERREGELKSQVDILKAENNVLSEESQKLNYENEILKSKMTSIPELKEAIRELKKLARSTGNRGFLVKDGQSTANAKIRIEVVPASQR